MSGRHWYFERRLRRLRRSERRRARVAGIRFSIISALIILPFSFTANSILLSTITDRGIQGAEPRLHSDLETEIANQAFNRFGFTYNGTNYDDNNISSFPLIAASTKVSAFKLQLTSTFKDTLIGNDATDANGDGNFKLVGIDNTNINKELGLDELSIKIRDGNNIDVSDLVTTKDKTFCELSLSNPGPYKIEISNNLRLTTEYGDPRKKDYTATTTETSLKQPSKQYLFSVIGACEAQPNLTRYGTGDYAGPTTQWDPTKGFKFQSNGINFPTTGSNGLSFKLTIVGATAQDVIDTMTSTVQASSTTNVSLLLSVESTNVLKVTLQGPKRPLGGEFNISTFKLNAGSTEIYSFTIGKWFIVKPNDPGGYVAVSNFCNGLEGDYEIPSIADYTNANGDGWVNGAVGNGNNYKRAINGGLLSEWGCPWTSSYSGSDWQTGYWWYWASESWGGTQQFYVHSDFGRIGHYDKSAPNVRAACVSK